SETWAGDVHPAQALRAYRHASGIEARWSSSAWSRTASRSPTRTTRGCSTSSASTQRRRSSSPNSHAAPSDPEGAARALRARQEAEMHLHLVRVAARPKQVPPRPAKVVQLDVRRQARLETARRDAQRPR